MASTFSAKSQPIYDFPLTKLKWSMRQPLRRTPYPTHSANDHSENRSVSPLKSPHHHHHHPSRKLVDSDSSRSGNTVRGCVVEEKTVTISSIPRSEKKLGDFNAMTDSKEGILNNCDGKSKISIRIPARNKVVAEATDDLKEILCGVEDEEPVAKTWNLRPRRAVTKLLDPNANGGGPQGGAPAVQSHPEAAAARGTYEEKVAQKRQNFSLSLMKEEIEEDFLLMTGSRPLKRPKKRARIVQKQLDGLFPGLWLASVTPDLYRVPDAHLKLLSLILF